MTPSDAPDRRTATGRRAAPIAPGSDGPAPSPGAADASGAIGAVHPIHAPAAGAAGLWPRAGRLLRFLDMRPRTLMRIWRIRRSGRFDAAAYRAASPAMHPVTRRFPIRHYVTFGEAMGLRPAPGFDPAAYRALNPDLGPALDNAAPLAFEHWVRHGHREARLTEWPMDRGADTHRPPPAIAARPPAARRAAVVHVFYPDLWPEIAQALAAARAALGGDLDLLVTLTERGAESAALADRIAAAFPGAQVWRMPNRGRDIGPFVHLAAAGALSGYAAICKLHTKRSPHRADGAAWRRALVGELLDPGPLPARLAAFEADPMAGIWTADGHVLGPAQWMANEGRTRALLDGAGLVADPAALAFPAGSMYWARPAVIDALAALGLGWFDFEPEAAQLDGTLAHAVERAMGYLAAAEGRTLRTTSGLGAAPRDEGRPCPS